MSEPAKTKTVPVNGDVIQHLHYIEREMDEVRDRICSIEKQQISGRLWDLIIKVGAALGFACGAMMIAHEVSLGRLTDQVKKLPPRYLTQSVELNAKMIDSIDMQLRALQTQMTANSTILKGIAAQLDKDK